MRVKQTYLIGNAHLDPVWLWRWQEGFSEILATFRSALDRMKEFPDFKFTSACAVYYEWVEKVDPEMFDEIRQRVREGRWAIVGGWFLQPDCNAPGGESFARHALIAQRYFRDRFGVTAQTGYNVDSFGHNASLPMILRLSGMENYVFMRPAPHENGDLYDLFNWRSADGSTVRCFRVPQFYNITSDRLDVLDGIIRSAQQQPQMAFYGVGNHGGGPTVQLLEQIERSHMPEGTVYATPDEYFDDTRALELPTVQGELQHHARGCYSANSRVKRANRAVEYALLSAEALCALSDALTGEAHYPAQKLKKAWKNLLFNQFHDILGGCAIKSAYADAEKLYGEALSIAEQAEFAAMTRICRRIDTRRGATMPSTKVDWRLWSCGSLGSPVVVFNPHAWDVEATVELTTAAARITDDDGNAVPVQRIRAEHTNGDDRYGSAFRARVPALGYAVYRIFTEGEAAPAQEVRAGHDLLENDRVRIEFDEKTGEIVRYLRKDTGEELLPHPTGTVLLDEIDCDTWAHNKTSLGQPCGSFGDARIEVVERGCVRSTLRATSHFGASTLIRDYTLENDSDALRVTLTVDFHEKHRAFKLTLPAGDAVRAAIPFGSIERPCGTGEEPCGEWLASGGLGYAGDVSCGYDAADGDFRPTLFRSAIYADHYGNRDEFCEYMEQGVSQFRYLLFPYTAPADAKRRADELNSGLRAVHDTFHDGSLPGKARGVGGGGDSLVVTAVKRGEEGGDVLRFVELNGEPARGTLTLFGKGIPFETQPHELHTYRDGSPVNLVEWPQL